MANTLTEEYLDKALGKLASKGDLALLRKEFKGDMTSLRDELKGDITAVHDEVKDVRTELKGDMTSLRDELKGDITFLRNDLEDVKTDVAETKTMVDSLTTSVDTYLKRTEGWHDELNVLQARFTRVVHLLDQKGIIKEADTHLA